MKTIVAVMLLIIMWATIPRSHAITPDEFSSAKGPVTHCYVQRDSLGEIKQVVWARYGAPVRSPLGMSREVRGDLQPVDDPASTFPIFGSASLYLLTETGRPEVRMFLQQYGGNNTNMMYFSAQSGLPDAWEQAGCPPSPASSQKRAASAGTPAAQFGAVR